MVNWYSFDIRGFILRVHVTKVVLKPRADREIINQACEEDSANESEVKRGVRIGDASDMVRAVDSESSVSEDDVKESRTRVQSAVRQVDSSQSPSLEAGAVVDDEMDVDVVGVSGSEGATGISEDGNHNWESVIVKKNGVLNLEKDNEIRYKSIEMTDDIWESATVIGPGGTVKGKNRNLFNIKKTDDNSLRESGCKYPDAGLGAMCVNARVEIIFVSRVTHSDIL